MNNTMIFCDMDGVLFDWDGSAERLLGKSVRDVSKNQVWKRIDQEGFKFWADLKPYPWAQDLVNLLKRLDNFCVLSSPSHDPRSVSGKLRSLQKFFGSRNFRDFVFTPQKHLLSRPGNVLIDDREKHIDAFNNVRDPGIGILFPREWNRNRKYAADPMAYVIERLKDIYPASRFPEEEIEDDESDYEEWLERERAKFKKSRSV